MFQVLTADLRRVAKDCGRFDSCTAQQRRGLLTPSQDARRVSNFIGDNAGL